MSGVKNLSGFPGPIEKNRNISAAHHAFTQLLCARIFILKNLLENIPSGTAAAVARRRWVFLQFSPPRVGGADIFVAVLRAIRGATPEVLMNIVRDTLAHLANTKLDLFPSAKGLFSVVDADHLKHYSPSADGASQRPVLREIIIFLHDSNIFQGVIFSGTGLPIPVVERALSSSSMKRGVGRHVRYIALSDDASDERLLQRMQYWLSGCYRSTASFIEILLSGANIPRHRVLTYFIYHTTGVTITYATDYTPINSASLLFQRNNAADPIQELRLVVMRWMIGSEATFLTKYQMHDGWVG
ncbi:hypothetical protein APHAL10511_004070 [Amanita phalloides]|nr:hypothetical protein APHAL10511_004070 [Amanita phalloides]